MDEPRRVLIIRRKAVGDVLVSMAVPAALRRAWPGAQIHMVVDRSAAQVAQGSPHVDELLVYSRELVNTGDVLSRMRNARLWLRRLRRVRYDVVLDLMGTPQTALWTRLTGARMRVGRRRRWRSWAYNRRLPRDGGPPRFAGEVFLDWVRALDIEPEPWTPVAPVRPAERDQEILEEIVRLVGDRGPLVVLVPGATWSAKAWPLRFFGRLGSLLRDELGARVLVAWGPGEEAIRNTVVQLTEGAARAMPATDLRGLAGYLSQSDLVITTDSGPKHLAVAEGTPTLTLFGSTDPRGWQPPTPGHRWITHEVPCRPCDRRVCNVPGHPCLDDLSPEQVLREARGMLGNGGPEA